MVDIQRIRCPIDFSDASRHVLEHAAASSGWYRAQITILHVYYGAPQPWVPAQETADLIVMGVHGRGVVERWVFGSTTHHVLREARRAVLTLGTDSRAPASDADANLVPS